MPISVPPIQLSLNPMSEPISNEVQKRSSLSRSSSSSSSTHSNDPEKGTGHSGSRKPPLDRSLGTFGSSWGISGVGMGFNSSWGTVDSDSESGDDQEEGDDDVEDEVEPQNEDHRDAASARLQLNTQLNSKGSYGFSTTGVGSFASSPAPMSASAYGAGAPGLQATSSSAHSSTSRDNSGPKEQFIENMAIQPDRLTANSPSRTELSYPAIPSASPMHNGSLGLSDPALQSTGRVPASVASASASGSRVVAGPTSAAAGRSSPLSVSPTSTNPAPASTSASIHPPPPASGSGPESADYFSVSATPARAQTLPPPPPAYTRSAPGTRRSSPVQAFSSLHPHAPPGHAITQASGSGNSLPHHPGAPFLSALTPFSARAANSSISPTTISQPPTTSTTPGAQQPLRPFLPARSTSSGSFLNQTSPRVRSRRRNASSNRISLVAGRRVPLPFDPTADPVDPLPPLIRPTPNNQIPSFSLSGDDNSSASPSPGTSPDQHLDLGRLSRGAVGQVDTASGSGSGSGMPFIAPLLHPPHGAPSRIPSATSVAAPFHSNAKALGSSGLSNTITAADTIGISSSSSPLAPASPSQYPSSPGTDNATNASPDVSLARTPSASGSLSRSSSRVHKHKKSRSKEHDSTVMAGGRTVDDFVILGEAGRGAYGLVKRVKEKMPDGSFGPLLIMKQVIKSRILADCWKKHALYGTIPIEIHVMAALSSSEYVLPRSRPWDPLRFEYWAKGETCSRPAPSELASAVADKLSGSAETPDTMSPASSRASTANTVSSIGGNSKSSSISSMPSQSEDDTTSSASKTPTAADSLTTPSKPRTPTTTSTPGQPLLSSSSTGASYKLDAALAGFGSNWEWRQGAVHHGHPSIIPLLEFFEDAHYYYLILPAALPSFPHSPHFPSITLPPAHPSSDPAGAIKKKFPSDLFDLVERFPDGLPTPLIRGYLGQIADGLAFLHERGICHRDIKDENVVLAEDGRCWLIDFGSSGVVRKEGWDTFSGTLDYAGPEILRGDSYKGPPQDVWAFGIVAFVLVVGECPFSSAAEASVGLCAGSKALMALESRCGRSPPPSDATSQISMDIEPPVIFPAASPIPPPSPSPNAVPVPSVTELDFSELFGGSGSQATHADFLGLTYSPELEASKLSSGLEQDGGGRMGDVAGLIRACLQLETSARPSFEDVLKCRYLAGAEGWIDWIPTSELVVPGPGAGETPK